jgi:1-acyl-sn-glycerol-3-phosphate acyltransferase
MIPANKNPFLDWILYQYVRGLARRSFHNICIRGLDRLRGLDPEHPAIVFSNHSNWWDALAVFLLTRAAPHKSFYCMMEEKQLRAYRFFSWLGAFSVDPGNPLRAAASVRYAIRLLQQKETLMWIFPQGEMVSPHQPIKLREGASYLATQSHSAQMLPIAFRYEFFREDKPLMLIDVGQPFTAHESNDERVAEACRQIAQNLDQTVRTQNLSGFETLFKPRLTINKKWEWFCLALQGRLREFNPAN